MNARIVLIAVVLLGAGLRVYDLGSESYWGDEIIMLDVAGSDVQRMCDDFVKGRPPVYVLLAHLWIKLFGTAEDATRSLSVVIGVAAIIACYHVGCVLFGVRVGLLSAFLLSISEFQIYYAQEFRYYALFVLLTLYAFLFFIMSLRDQRRRFCCAYVITTALLFYTHTYGVFVIAAQGIYMLIRWRHHKRRRVQWLLNQSLILALITPGLILAVYITITKTVEVMEWIPDPQWWTPIRTVLVFVFPRFTRPDTTFIFTVLAAGISYFVVGLLAVHWRRRMIGGGIAMIAAPDEEPSPETFPDRYLLVALWLLCPIVFPYILSKVFGPIYIDRYTISAAPAVYFLLSRVIEKCHRNIPAFLSITALVVLIVPGLCDYYRKPVKHQWREIASYIEQHARPGDVVVTFHENQKWWKKAFDWYFDADVPVLNFRRAQLPESDDIRRSLAPYAASAAKIYGVSAHRIDEQKLVYGRLEKRGMTAMTLLKTIYFEGFTVQVIKLSAATTDVLDDSKVKREPRMDANKR